MIISVSIKPKWLYTSNFDLFEIRERIMTNYQKKLNVAAPPGAIFALKSMGWNEFLEPKPLDDTANTVLKVAIIQTGPLLAEAEYEVVL